MLTFNFKYLLNQIVIFGKILQSMDVLPFITYCAFAFTIFQS